MENSCLTDDTHIFAWQLHNKSAPGGTRSSGKPTLSPAGQPLQQNALLTAGAGCLCTWMSSTEVQQGGPPFCLAACRCPALIQPWTREKGRMRAWLARQERGQMLASEMVLPCEGCCGTCLHQLTGRSGQDCDWPFRVHGFDSPAHLPQALAQQGNLL